MGLRRTATRLGIPMLAVALATGCAGTGRPLSDALLPRSALPLGLQYRQIDEFPDLSQAFAGTTFRPPICGSPAVLHPYGDPSRLEAAVYVGSARNATLTIGLVRGPAELDLDRSRATVQRCANLTIETPDSVITGKLQEVPAPDVDADDVFAYSQTLTGMEGPRQTRRTLFLAAVDDGVVVTVTGDAGDADLALFTELLRRSLQRKNEVLG